MNTKIFKFNAFLAIYGLLKIPLLVFIGPKVVEMTDKKFVIKIPLGYRTKNHLNSMYFGALGVGAELSIAAPAVQVIAESKQKIDFIFKDFTAQYGKRADGDVHFVCDEVESVVALINEAKTNPARIERKMKGYAIVPSKSDEPVMTYELTLSVRNRSIKS
ncbi:DUF4442 domain-containing protein [Bdellovibrio sp. HCB274]|uniref:DUF4442 domain-containing protein n=1 Tax=Bdellovibrio sp. HCB274 TaxID=3394361 RepID=UPI0039B60C9C